MTAFLSGAVSANDLAIAILNSGHSPSASSPLAALVDVQVSVSGVGPAARRLDDVLPTLLAPTTLLTLTHVNGPDATRMMYWGRPDHPAVGLWEHPNGGDDFFVVGPLDRGRLTQGFVQAIPGSTEAAEMEAITLDPQLMVAFAAALDTHVRADVEALLGRFTNDEPLFATDDLLQRIGEANASPDARWFTDKLALAAPWPTVEVTHHSVQEALDQLVGKGLLTRTDFGWAISDTGRAMLEMVGVASYGTILAVTSVGDGQPAFRYLACGGGLGITLGTEAATMGGHAVDRLIDLLGTRLLEAPRRKRPPARPAANAKKWLVVVADTALYGADGTTVVGSMVAGQRSWALSTHDDWIEVPGPSGGTAWLPRNAAQFDG